jgi:hypothetical protein
MGRLDADDGELAARFRSMDEASRRRFACAMVRFALKDCDPPVALPPTAEQRPQRRRLARAVGAQEPDEPPGLDLEAQVVDGDRLAVAFREMVDVDG